MASMRYYSAKGQALRHLSGRNYAGAAGSVVDVPETESDGADHPSLGYVRLGRSGTTAQRPTVTSSVPPRIGEPFCDTTLTKVIFWTGSVWVDMTGATV
jgi:hypothetical protein